MFEKEPTPRELLSAIHREMKNTITNFTNVIYEAIEPKDAGSDTCENIQASLINDFFTINIYDEYGEVITITNQLEKLKNILEEIIFKLDEFLPDLNWRAIDMMTGIQLKAIKNWKEDLYKLQDENPDLNSEDINNVAKILENYLRQIDIAIERIYNEPEFRLESE